MTRAALFVLGHVVLAAVVVFAAVELAGYREPRAVLVWAVGVVLVHDLLLLPFYSGVDRVLPRAVKNYVRIPLALSGLLLLVFFPLIVGRSDAAFMRNAGYEPEGYLARWLVVCALIFMASGAVYLVRRGSRT